MLFQTFYWKCFSPGFYCLEGSKTATPMSSVSGGVCPAGHYCTEGSSVPSPCPAGSYQNETGGKGRDDCKPCPFGKQEAVLYDLSSVLSGDVLTDWMSLPGWFQDLSGQTECNPCPPGFHCQSLSSSPTSPLPCPAGYICPRESPDRQPLPCPKGTYSPNQGLTTTGKKPKKHVNFLVLLFGFFCRLRRRINCLLGQVFRFGTVNYWLFKSNFPF